MHRTFQDISPSWEDVILNNLYAQTGLGKLGKPGSWNDPDFMEVCNPHANFSKTQDKTHFSLWAVVSAPLIMGHDVSGATSCVDILGNTEVIAINQGWAGNAGDVVGPDRHVWGKPLPNGEAAVVLHNADDARANVSTKVTLHFSDLHWETEDPGKNVTYTATKYKVRDLWLHKDLGIFEANFTADAINGTDSVTIKLTPVTAG